MADPRIQRSCQKLANALLELLQEQPANLPGIEQLLKRAGVARATFYSHFTDINALLSWQVDQMLDEIYASIDWRSHDSEGLFSGRVVRAVLLQAKRQSGLFRLLLTGAAGPIPMERIYSRFYQASLDFNRQRCTQQNIQPQVPLEVICSSISGQLIGLLRWTVLHDPNADTEQLVAWMRQIYLHGFSQLLRPAPT
jgi:AcrR family transcriptional regulator